ncbi:hypothetical protein D1621_30220 [Klebsiella pneumoniae]|nr:hypothetical protein D1621_30220 [Klebsiella pneumoniae]
MKNEYRKGSGGDRGEERIRKNKRKGGEVKERNKGKVKNDEQEGMVETMEKKCRGEEKKSKRER